MSEDRGILKSVGMENLHIWDGMYIVLFLKSRKRCAIKKNRKNPRKFNRKNKRKWTKQTYGNERGEKIAIFKNYMENFKKPEFKFQKIKLATWGMNSRNSL